MLLIAAIDWLQWAELSHHNLYGAMLNYMMQSSLVKKKKHRSRSHYDKTDDYVDVYGTFWWSHYRIDNIIVNLGLS